MPGHKRLQRTTARDWSLHIAGLQTAKAAASGHWDMGTLSARIRGATIFPSSILNRFHVLLAALRQLHLIVSTCLLSSEMQDLSPDVFVVDQLSACVPLLRWLWPRQRVLFYCHFPDQLLAARGGGALLGVVKSGYRAMFDWLEGWSMRVGDQVVVNSRFTRGVVEGLFGKGRLGALKVVYPCVSDGAREEEDVAKELWSGKKVLLSVDRFERKKDLRLAIRAFDGLDEEQRRGIRLVLAGGYDVRVTENVQYHKELVALADSLGLRHATAKTVPSALGIPANIEVLFLLSVPGAFKSVLLRDARLLVYTPTDEHFGIVPVEAMQHGTPVLAANSGGPLETVVDGKTGWLKDVKDVRAWTCSPTLKNTAIEPYSFAISLLLSHAIFAILTPFSASILVTTSSRSWPSGVRIALAGTLSILTRYN